jgi:hypothetical protein
MRKNSNQILKEVRLDHELHSFKESRKLLQCIDDMLAFRINELEALLNAMDMTKDNPVLREWVMTKVIEHSKQICSVLGVTVEGFKVLLDDMDRKRENYEQIRNGVRQQIYKQPKETSH